MQSSICEHRDDGKAGGVFDSYEILKVIIIIIINKVVFKYLLLINRLRE